MQENDCFTPENFEQVKAYIAYRILVSSSGEVFYLEFPLDESAPQDGIKRASRHPENVYKVHFDELSHQIIIENKLRKFHFTAQEGLVLMPTRTPQEQALAQAIFCHLVASRQGRESKTLPNRLL